ncbi:MAG: outer membrane beta-barrel protein [Steroidobacteraceae bacterium]
MSAQSPAPSPAPTQGSAAPAQGAPAVAAAGGFYIYPRNGQSEQQQSTDRYACHTWAHQQTGFDPTVSGGGVAPNEEAAKRSEYGRAMTACLDARGYSVRYAAPTYVVPAGPAPIASASVQHYSVGPQLKYRPFEAQIDGGYSIATGKTKQYLDNGSNVGLGFAWFPTSALPLGLRVDGSYSSFDARNALLDLNGAGYTYGHEHIYGGDADLQLDLAHRSSRAKLYLFGGLGWYREQTELRQVSWVNGTVCGWYFCGPGYFPALTAAESVTSAWHKSWNAGIGWEIAVADRTSFFIEARYQRILPNDGNMQFVPIKVGLRF